MINITKENIISAHKRIKPYIHRTPVFSSGGINSLLGCEIFFKCENFQKIGAFKIRGALNAALQLPEEKLVNGLCTHSSGNHAQAIALAGKILKTKAYIVMPENSPAVKINAVREYGAEIFFCKPTLEAREEEIKKVMEKTASEFIHPYDNEYIITGQATAAKELIEDSPKLDYILAPVGGGGLLSGTLLAAHYFSTDTKVYAGEPEGAADAILSLRSGKIEKAPYINTIADGLLTTLSERTLEIIKKYVSDIFLVNDEEIISALKMIFQRLKIVVEPSSAVPLAALIKNNSIFRNHKIGIILSGGNIDFPPAFKINTT